MNIICTFDDKYAEHAAAMIASVIHYNRNVSFFCISDFISETNQRKIKSIFEERDDILIEFIFVSIDIFKDYPIGKKFFHLSPAAYYRLLISNILPLNVLKVIYLDCDIIVNGSLQDLWDTHLEKNVAVLAVEDNRNNVINGPMRLGYLAKFSYFNSGVMLLNIEYLRKINFSDNAIDYIRQNTDKIIFHDQDVLNALLFDKKLIIDLKWNVMHFMFIQNAMDKYFDKEKLNHLRRKPIIIHFTGKYKPWQRECKHPYKYKYVFFLNKTPFAPFEDEILYKGKGFILYRIKQSTKFLLDLLKIRPSRFINLKDY